MRVTQAKEMISSLNSDNERSIADIRGYEEDIANTLNQYAFKLENELLNIRQLLNANPDKSCLGTGYTDKNEPYSILEAAISDITKALEL